jgi:hypothetical protein
MLLMMTNIYEMRLRTSHLLGTSTICLKILDDKFYRVIYVSSECS